MLTKVRGWFAGTWTVALLLCGVWLGVLLCAGIPLLAAEGQEPTETESTEVEEEADSEPTDTSAQMDDNVRFMHGGIRLGPFEVRPRLTTGVLYDDNIFINSGVKVDDLIWTISPGANVGLGDHLLQQENFLAFDYSPSAIFFTHESSQNSVDHEFLLASQWTINKLTLGLGQGIRTDSGGVVEAGQRTKSQTYRTDITSEYDLTGKISVEVNGSLEMRRYDTLFDLNEWRNRNWLNYQVLPKIKAGLGVTFGYREIQANPNQTYEQLLVRLVYDVSGKTDITTSFGGEFRQVSGGGSSFDPVFTLAANYRPFDSMTVGLNGYFQNENSLTTSLQNIDSLGFDLSVRQRFLQRIFVTLRAGYEHAVYESTLTGTRTGREDDYYVLGLSANWRMTRRFLMGVSYNYRKNDSTQVPFSNNRFGLQSTFTF